MLLRLRIACPAVFDRPCVIVLSSPGVVAPGLVEPLLRGAVATTTTTMLRWNVEIVQRCGMTASSRIFTHDRSSLARRAGDGCTSLNSVGRHLDHASGVCHEAAMVWLIYDPPVLSPSLASEFGMRAVPCLPHHNAEPVNP